MNCIQLSQQADLIANTFSKLDLAKLVVALKGSGESLQNAVEVIDTVDARQGYTLEKAWDEVRTGENRPLAANDD
ncbi:hypothetical protein [Halomonas alkalicola]|uniref:Nif11 domain-containing protein n=1 Tax=Halomonas alkalicola TaxID=1930622 RepID=A0ABY9H364_9GAMM|nr:hypothetical protein [Halomonas alkalicola]WLI72673.1 hypothetical protein B6N23_13025 [Halomonas alkalicola]